MARGKGGVPTIKEVAERAGVALSSVSRVINDHPDVSERMRSEVHKAIDELGYEPNLVASSLRRGSTKTIGCVLSDISNVIFADFTWGAERALDEAGYSMVLTNSEGQPERDEEMARMFKWRRVDGLIMILSDETRRGTIEELRDLDIPLVLTDREVAGLAGASTVLADHATGIQEATDHLLELGHRRIAFVGGTDRIRPGRERLRGFRAGMERAGVEIDPALVRIGSFSRAYGEASVDELVALEDAPTAIIIGGNMLLIGAMRSLRRAGKEVGRDVSIISCDDVPLAELSQPPITVIDRDMVEMGQVAAELMLERIRDEAPPRDVTVATRLLLRESTRPV